MDKFPARPKWILYLFIISLSVMIAGSAIFGIVIQKKATAANLAFPGQMANTLRGTFGVEFVEWLQKKLYVFHDVRRRFVISMFGEKIHTRTINRTEIIRVEHTDLSGAPVNIQPFLSIDPLPGEGKWTHEGLPKINNKPVIYQTILRVDPKRPYSTLEVASIDISKIRFHLVAGSAYRGVKNQKGTGFIHYLHRPILIAAMNGGFLPVHKTGGMIINGKVFLPMEAGKATFIMYKNDTVKMVVWNREMMNDLPDIRHARQNLEILLSDGKFNKKARYWGIVKPGEDAVYNWRSGIGLTRDRKRLIFIAGNATSPQMLARAFVLAGCDIAMHMDMNISNIAFSHFRHRDGDIQPIGLSQRFWQHMIDAYLKGYTHDFIYMTKREE